MHAYSTVYLYTVYISMYTYIVYTIGRCIPLVYSIFTVFTVFRYTEMDDIDEKFAILKFLLKKVVEHSPKLLGQASFTMLRARSNSTLPGTL